MYGRVGQHVAGSLMDLDPEQIVVIYNRVPKTGSTSLIGLAYDLCVTNAFNVIHINTSRNSPTLSLSDQVFLYSLYIFYTKNTKLLYCKYLLLTLISFKKTKLR